LTNEQVAAKRAQAIEETMTARKKSDESHTTKAIGTRPRHPRVKSFYDRPLDRAPKNVRKRARELVSEARWAVHDFPLPSRQECPPQWVRRAIRRAILPVVALSKRLETASGDRRELLVLEFMGMAQAINATMAEGAPVETHSIWKENRYCYQRQRMVSDAIRTIVPNLRRELMAWVKRRKHSQGIVQLRSGSFRMKKGIDFMMCFSGEKEIFESRMRKLALKLWFYWPHLTAAKDFREIHGALNPHALGMSVAGIPEEVAEALCSEIGLSRSSGERPNPQQPTRLPGPRSPTTRTMARCHSPKTARG
jgi:hypothetical protein